MKEQDHLTDEQALSLPGSSFTPGQLSQLWSRKAETRTRLDLAQLARENTDDYSGPRRFTTQAMADKKAAAQREARDLTMLRFQLQQFTQETKDRTDDLLRRIDEEEQRSLEKLAQLRKRAIVLSDGRRIYVGDRGDYLDEQGQTLQAQDAQEARAKHATQPDATTWKEKTDVEHQCEEARRLKEKVQNFRDKSDRREGTPEEIEQLAKQDRKELEGYEAEFQQKIEGRKAELAESPTDYGSADYMALTTSYASTLDLKGAGLKDSFRPAAEGQGTEPTSPTTAPAVTQKLAR